MLDEYLARANTTVRLEQLAKGQLETCQPGTSIGGRADCELPLANVRHVSLGPMSTIAPGAVS